MYCRLAHLANTIQRSARGGDATLCQITLTTCHTCCCKEKVLYCHNFDAKLHDNHFIHCLETMDIGDLLMFCAIGGLPIHYLSTYLERKKSFVEVHLYHHEMFHFLSDTF